MTRKEKRIVSVLSACFIILLTILLTNIVSKCNNSRKLFGDQWEFPEGKSEPYDSNKEGDYHAKIKRTVSKKGFSVYDMPTKKVSPGRNRVEGVILHHTVDYGCEMDISYNPNNEISAHVVIGSNGARYVLAPPTAITWHAGKSYMNGKRYCNNFTIGIEFEGNTCNYPLTEKQISSAIEYLLPIIRKYNIPLSNITTHKRVRDAWNKRFPEQKTAPKVDITDKEYKHFMKELKKVYNQNIKHYGTSNSDSCNRSSADYLASGTDK